MLQGRHLGEMNRIVNVAGAFRHRISSRSEISTLGAQLLQARVARVIGHHIGWRVDLGHHDGRWQDNGNWPQRLEARQWWRRIGNPVRNFGGRWGDHVNFCRRGIRGLHAGNCFGGGRRFRRRHTGHGLCGWCRGRWRNDLGFCNLLCISGSALLYHVFPVPWLARGFE